jgi:hypothetical protein
VERRRHEKEEHRGEKRDSLAAASGGPVHRAETLADFGADSIGIGPEAHGNRPEPGLCAGVLASTDPRTGIRIDG